jgi:hypothetical protein
VFWTTRDERLFALRLSDDAVAVISVSSVLKLGTALAVTQEALKALRGLGPMEAVANGFPRVFEAMSEVAGAGLLERGAPSFRKVFFREEGRSRFAFDSAMAGVVGQFFDAQALPVPVVFHVGDGAASSGEASVPTENPGGATLDVVDMQVTSAAHTRGWWTVPFDPEHLFFVLADRQTIPQGLVVTIANRATEETVRVWASGLLAWGIDAILEPFPQTQREFLQIVEELRHLHQYDLIARLRVGGFTNYSMGQGEAIQRCQECIYYHPHR